MVAVSAFFLAAVSISATAFSPVRVFTARPSKFRIRRLEESATTAVQRLLDAVDATKSEDAESSSSSSSTTQPRHSVQELSSLFRELEEAYSQKGGKDEDKAIFQSLLGLYDVAFVQTEKEGDNPVGGKWTRKGGVAQKILRTRRAFQHLLPTNSTGLGRTVLEVSDTVNDLGGRRSVVAEAVNVISLDALFGLVRLTVMLRGDAVMITPEERRRCEERQLQRLNATKTKFSDVVEAVTPLSPRTVRAYFDAPRIVFGRQGRLVNLSVGPMSDVVLDTTYCDDRIRVGKGGNSGTRFLFQRCSLDDTEANEWKSLLARRPLKKWKALWTLGIVAGFGFRSAVRAGALPGRIIALLASALATVTGTAVLFSAGGIERDELVRVQ